MKKWIWVVLVLLLMWNSFLTYRLLYPQNNNHNTTDDINVTEESVTDYTTDLTAIVEKTRANIVRINYNYGQEEVAQSGVIITVIDNKAYVVTSKLAQKANISIVFDNGKSTKAVVEKTDLATGISILSFESDFNIEPIKLGDSSLLEQGEYVIALGARMKEGNAPVSFGIVSETGYRKMTTTSSWYAEILETDVSIHERLYGGALMNVGGELIGVIVQSPANATDKIGYALSVDEIKLVSAEVMEGEISRGQLNVITRDVNKLRSYEKSAWNIALNQSNGVLIINNLDDNEEGLLVGDVLTSWNGEDIENYQTLRRLEYEARQGEKVRLKVIRSGRTIDLEVELK